MSTCAVGSACPGVGGGCASIRSTRLAPPSLLGTPLPSFFAPVSGHAITSAAQLLRLEALELKEWARAASTNRSQPQSVEYTLAPSAAGTDGAATSSWPSLQPHPHPPAQPLLPHAQLLRHHSFGSLRERLQLLCDDVDIISAASDRLHSVINKLMSLQAVRAGRVPLRPAVTDLCAVLQEAAAVNALVAAVPVRVFCDSTTRHADVFVDGDLLHQVRAAAGVLFARASCVSRAATCGTCSRGFSR